MTNLTVVPAQAGTHFDLVRLHHGWNDELARRPRPRLGPSRAGFNGGLFSFSAQIMRQREAYYAALERPQRGTLDVTEWLGWFLEQVASACDLAEGTIEHVLAKARFWLRHQGTALNDRQRKVINVLLDAGPDRFVGGMNTRKYVSLTRTSRATAYRELADLVEKRCLISSGGGRSVNYQLRWD